ncbi:MAG TPA: hypothetical protein DCS60_05700 [Opitutae bacterium]|nr:hypothetical protein [Opitutae bacterium]
MDTWFLDNLEKLVPIVIALLYFLGASKTKKNVEKEVAPDSEADDRARKIQEEIRRKISERQKRGNAPVQRESPPDLPRPEVAQPLNTETESYREFTEVEVLPRSEESALPPFSKETNLLDFYEEQNKEVEERLRKSREISSQARLSDVGSEYERPITNGTQNALNFQRYARVLDGLDDPEALRRAVVFKEILDSPVALR